MQHSPAPAAVPRRVDDPEPPCGSEAREGRLEGRTLLALTIWQPWASAIVRGFKRIENRKWVPPPGVVGRYIAIHAGQTIDEPEAFSICHAPAPCRGRQKLWTVDRAVAGEVRRRWREVHRAPASTPLRGS